MTVAATFEFYQRLYEIAVSAALKPKGVSEVFSYITGYTAALSSIISFNLRQK